MVVNEVPGTAGVDRGRARPDHPLVAPEQLHSAATGHERPVGVDVGPGYVRRPAHDDLVGTSDPFAARAAGDEQVVVAPVRHQVSALLGVRGGCL